jgi:HNH endonuclease
MARSHIPARLRRLVIERARGCCEYCLLHQDDTDFAHHVDHLIALKHGGRTEEENLALACMECNLRKGPDLAAIDPVEGVMVELFNPRVQRWSEHFTLVSASLVGETPTGRATVALLRMNDPARLLERQRLIVAGRYPRTAP